MLPAVIAMHVHARLHAWARVVAATAARPVVCERSAGEGTSCYEGCRAKDGWKVVTDAGET
jgi:hypothetical protein